MISEINAGETDSTRDITFICFVGSNPMSVLAPLWFYGSAIRNLYLFFNTDHSSSAGKVYSELMASPEFAETEIHFHHYSRNNTCIGTFKQLLERKAPSSDDNSEIIIGTFGCSKPVFLSTILFAEKYHASIILSANFNSFEIFEDGVIRSQAFPNTLRWYLGHYKLHLYPKINAPSLLDPIIPEKELQDKPELIEDHQMESVVTGTGISLTVDFACTTKTLLILGKMFTEDGEPFDMPSRIFSESLKNFGGNCRILIYAVGDDLYRRLKERLGRNKHITIINIPDPWCLIEYPEYFRDDLWRIIRKKID